MRTYRDLRVWQKAYAVALGLHRDTAGFPTEERFELARDLRRTSRSLISNIAEGSGRRTLPEQIHFLNIASGSASELECQVLLAAELGYLESGLARDYLRRISDIRRMLYGMMKALRQSHIADSEAGRRTPGAGRLAPTADAAW